MKLNLKHTDAIVDYLSITLGVCIYAFTLAFCVLPYKLTSGGVTGIGTLVYYATGLEVQNTFFIINALLLIAAVKELGWRFCIKTIYATMTLTVALWLAQRVYEFVGSPVIVGDELFLACILSALGSGLGLALCFTAGGSTGGTDIIAAIVNKYRNMGIGRVIMIVDIAIISSCYFVFHDIQRVVFGYIFLIISSLTLDYLLNRSHQSVEFKIYSRNPYLIAEAIKDSGHGVTILEGMGYYTKSERKVVVCVVNRRERLTLFRLIKFIDPYAFVTMGNVSGVWGEGFDAIEAANKAARDKKQILVMVSDSEQEVTDAKQALGDGIEVRTLSEIGCDPAHPISKDIQSDDPVVRARTVKYYYGYDCVSVDKSAAEPNALPPLILVTGKAATDNLRIMRYDTYADIKAELTQK